MNEKPDNIVLEHLRYMRKGIDDIREDVRDVKLLPIPMIADSDSDASRTAFR